MSVPARSRPPNDSPVIAPRGASGDVMPRRSMRWRRRSSSNAGSPRPRMPSKFPSAERPAIKPNLNEAQAMKHLLTLDNLPRAELEPLLDRAQAFADGGVARDA